MKSICSILTMAATLALGACASDNMTMDSKGKTDDPNRYSLSSDTTTYSADGTPTRVSQANIDAIHQALPDNPQLGGGNDKNATQGLSQVDRDFLIASIQGGDFEVASSQKALLKSENVGVKSLAQYIVDDHVKVNQQAENLASRRGLRVPLGQSSGQIEKLAQLDKLSGAEFDAEYLRQQGQAHDDAIALFSAAASSANDKFIRDWAAATVPGLRNHRDMINALQGRSNDIGMVK